MFHFKVSGQQHAVCKYMVFPQIGDAERSHLSVYIIAFSLPLPSTFASYKTRPPPDSLQMSSHCCFVKVRTNTLGGPNRWLSHLCRGKKETVLISLENLIDKQVQMGSACHIGSSLCILKENVIFLKR